MAEADAPAVVADTDVAKPVALTTVPAETQPAGAIAPQRRTHTGSLSRRMLLIASAWILVLLLGGGAAPARSVGA